MSVRGMAVAMVLCDIAVSSAHPSGSNLSYVSPVPGSTMVSRETNIVIRTGSIIDPNALPKELLLEVVGSKSGNHPGRYCLSDDSVALIFIPREYFLPGEHVTVSTKPAFWAMVRRNPRPFSFMFTVTPLEREVQLAPWMQNMIEDMDARNAPSSRSLGLQDAITDNLPPDFPRIVETLSDGPTPGYLFLSNFSLDTTVSSAPYLMILENSGFPVFYRKMRKFCADFKLQPTGVLTYFDSDLGYFVGLDSSYAVVDSFRCGNGYTTDLHELRLLPNGHALLMSYDPQVVRMDTIVPGGDPNALVIGLIVQELDRNRNVVFQWRSWDHFSITDATHMDFSGAFIDCVHGNAIECDSTGNIIISSRHMDEITKIDRQTGKILWRLGGKHNQFTFVNDPIGFSHQHAIRILSSGHITLFDNGNYHDPPFSRAVEYALDEQSMTATLVWQYQNTLEVYGSALGYVQRLDDGNTLIGWGSAKLALTEVRPDGSKALELALPADVYSYRVYRFPWKATTLAVESGSEIPRAYSLDQNFPNPFNPSTVIRYEVPVAAVVTLRVYDLLGREVATLVDGLQEPGYKSAVFDGTGVSSGAYFYQLRVNQYSETRRMMIVR